MMAFYLSVIGMSVLGPPKTTSTYDFGPDALKQKAPLERFTTVPFESLPNLKSSPYSVKNAFPTKEYQEARMRARKAQTGITFFQADEEESTQAFPVLIAKGTPKKKKTVGQAPGSSFAISTIYESSSETSKWGLSTPVKTHGNKMTSQSSLSNLASPYTDGTAYSTPASTPCTLFLESETPSHASASQDGRKPESVTTEEDDEVHLYPVYQKEELEEISKILSNDAGLVSHWRVKFAENKAKLNSGLEEKLFKRHSDMDDVYRNASMFSQVVSILLPSKGHHTKRKGTNIWKATKEKAQEDPSSFPSRKQFYQKLVRTIEEFGGVRSDLDEQILCSIRKKLQNGHPADDRLIFALADECGAECVLDHNSRNIISYLCDELKVDYERVLTYLNSKGFDVSSQMQLHSIKTLQRSRERNMSTVSVFNTLTHA